MDNEELENIQKAIRLECLDGWLFCNFHHRDLISNSVLHISTTESNSRMWIYAVPAHGKPLKILHKVESENLSSLLGDTISYVSREEFFSAVSSLKNKNWGVNFSENLPAISYLDLGTANLLKKAGLNLKSAEGLIQRFKGLLDNAGIESHEKSANHLYEIIEISWEKLKKAFTNKESLYEGDIRSLMLNELEKRNLITHRSPIVGFGKNSGNPHYDFPDRGSILHEGDVIQFDIWAKENSESAIYADISWIGFAGFSIPSKIEKTFNDLIKVREETFNFIKKELDLAHRLTGYDVDAKARELLISLNYTSEIKHRTGHGIDTECHGSGVNIDSVEFPDKRFILEGSCFSLEPGIYFPDFGMRTEIDVYILNGNPKISGKDRQFKLLTC